MKTITGLGDWVRASVWRVRLLVGMGFVAMAAVFSWPLPMYLSERAVLARGADFYQHIWNLWWVKFSLLTLHQDPYSTSYLHYPSGQSLVYHVVDPLNGVLSIPLQGAFGLLAAFNLLRLAHLVFSATAAYALCRTLRMPRLAAWVGGALYAMCPIAATSFDLGQLVEISTGWIPLYVLCLFKGLGNRAMGMPAGSWRWLVGASLSLTASALSTWYFFTALVLFTALYVAWEVGSGVRSEESGVRSQTTHHASRITFHAALRPIARGAAIGVGAGALLSPLIIALLRENASGGDYLVSPLRTIIANSADLVSLFMPAPARFNDATINPHGGSPALGWSVIALVVLGLVLRKRLRRGGGAERQLSRGHVYFWLAAAILFALLAIGPHLLVWGNDTGVPMPYLLLNKVPFLGAARVPIRFMLVASLAMSVLAAYGLVALARVVRGSRERVATFGAVGALLAVELVGIPRTLITPTVHPFFESIAARGDEGGHEAVMELPAGVRAAPAMLDQSAHQHSILEGYTARHYPYPWFDATPGIAQLGRSDADALSAKDIVTPPIGDTALTALDYYGVRYVAVYATGNAGLDTRASEAASRLFGPHNIAPIIQDDTLTVYKVPPQPRSGPLVGLGSGWYGVEGGGDRLWRWTDGNVSVQVTNPLTSTMPVRILLRAYAVSQSRTMVVTLDGREVARQEIGPYPSQQVAVDADITPGEHWVQISSVQPPETPPGDSRRLSIGFEGVGVERR